jgi:hypothetical protein
MAAGQVALSVVIGGAATLGGAIAHQGDDSIPAGAKKGYSGRHFQNVKNFID